MSMLGEFLEYAVKGNMIDMAVGIIIGGAFGKIISSLVGDVLMPPLGVALGGVDFTNLSMTLKPALDKAPAVVLGYGKFLQTSFDFLIVAAAMCMVIKAINTLKKEKPAAPTAPPPPTKEEVLLTEIRDLLAKR